MTQTVQLDVLNSNTGVSFGSTVYQLDGTTQYSAFSTSGWSELPAGSGSWHNSALTLPDAGGVVAYGVSGNEYNRATFGPATLAASNYTTPPTVTAIRQEMDSNSTKLANLDATVSSRSTYSGGAVASVTGNVGGNVVGSIGSLATQAKADVNAETDTALADAGVTTTVTGRIDAAITTRATPANVTSAQTAITDAIDALHDITAADVVTALMSYSVESGKDYATVLKEVYAILRGKFVADNATPTSIVYYAPDGTTVRVTHTLTDTTRTPS